ncbi:MAG: sugar phosphate nucleotidyltransferase [Candidatus Omnitrophota bacterium]
MENFSVVILAAGQGKRMKSALPKAVYDLIGSPLVFYPLKEVLRLKRYLKEIIVVVGHKGKMVEQEVKKCFSAGTKIKFVDQPRRLGTANALAVATQKIKYKNVLVLCADTPLIRAETLKAFIASFIRRRLSCSLITANEADDNSLGVITRDRKGKLKAIQEKAEIGLGSTRRKKSTLINQEVSSGIYCFKYQLLKQNLSLITKNKRKKEYFLTDIVEILYNQGERIDTYLLDSAQEISGINTQKDLWKAAKVIRQRVLEELSCKGVKIIDPETTFIESGVVIGKNTLIYPFTFIEKGVIIGNNCSLGPYLRLRKGSSVGDNTQVGNFLEINRTQVGKKVRIKHFGYLGDTQIAEGVNIGAGTVAANYDGKSKQRTDIERYAFIGSDTILVAPVKIGKGAITGAGSVVTKNVKPNTVVVGVPARELKKKKRVVYG